MNPVDAVKEHLPELRVEGVSELGSGLENTAFLVRAERDLVVRYRHEHDPVAVRNEARLLMRVAEVSPLPVPEVAFFDERCLAYWFLPGRPLEPGDGIETAVLGDLIEQLQALPLAEMTEFVKVDHDPLEQWRDEAAEVFERHKAGLPEDTRKGIEAFLGEELPEPTDRLAFSHNDLGIEHVLVEGQKITGIIDWSDAAICDPAYDYGLLIRDLAARAPVPPPELAQRALFYAKVSAIEDFDYGRDRGVLWLF